MVCDQTDGDDSLYRAGMGGNFAPEYSLQRFGNERERHKLATFLPLLQCKPTDILDVAVTQAIA